jgi:hypothetical protein
LTKAFQPASENLTALQITPFLPTLSNLMKLRAVLIAVVISISGTGAKAATTVLYETGWEAAPAAPAWVSGGLAPQNGWQSEGVEPTPGLHRVVGNGSPEANPFGTPITTPYGNQFLRFTASSSSVMGAEQLSWVDLSSQFTQRPAGYSRLTGSMDFFVPSNESADASVYGLFGFDGNYLDFGFLIIPNSRTIVMVTNAVDGGRLAGAFPYNTWFNVGLRLDYATGRLDLLTNGIAVPGLSSTIHFQPGAAFTDLDLVSANSTGSPNPRTIFSDNYRVIVEEPPPELPRLTIQPGTIGKWHLTWGSAFEHWILESTHNLQSGSTVWVNENAIPTVMGGTATWDVMNAPPNTFYRLRKPD